MSDRSQAGSRAEKGRLQVPGGSKHVSRIKPGCMPTEWGRPRADYAEAEGGVRTPSHPPRVSRREQEEMVFHEFGDSVVTALLQPSNLLCKSYY